MCPDDKHAHTGAVADNHMSTEHLNQSEVCVSVCLDHHRLKYTWCHSVGEMRPTQGSRTIFTYKQSQVAVFIVAAVGKVLALDNLLHDLVSVDAGVIHTAVLLLHSVLLPPGGSVGHEGSCRRWRRSIWFGGSHLSVHLGGGGGRRLGSVGQPAGDAAAGGGVTMVTQVSQAGGTRVTCAVA